METIAAPRPPAMTSQVATRRLDFSGAMLSVREDYAGGRAVAHCTLYLTAANGRARNFRLPSVGGATANQSLNLYNIGDTRYFLASEKDCVELDPIGATVRNCPARLRFR
jgi:hypothetical protein